MRESKYSKMSIAEIKSELDSLYASKVSFEKQAERMMSIDAAEAVLEQKEIELISAYM